MHDVRGCYARLDGDELIVGNAHVERRWRLRDGLLYATSLVEKSEARQWLARPAERPAPCPPSPLAAGPRGVRLSTSWGRASCVEEQSLLAELTSRGEGGVLRYCFRVFPEAAGIVAQLIHEGAAAPAAPAAPDAAHSASPTGVELTDAAQRGGDRGLLDLLERFEPAGAHLRLSHVRLLDQTDIHNELVFEDQWLLHPNEAELLLSGNLFVLEDNLGGSGLIMLKLCPLPHARAHKSAWDLRASGTPACYYDAGPLSPQSPRHPLAYRITLAGGAGAGPEGYPWAILAYRGGRFGRIAALQRFQRQYRPYVTGRDGAFLSNTWGDRSRDAAIGEAFIRKEIQAGARFGVDVVQIDDGWQQGVTANSSIPGGVWSGFWAADPHFWRPSARRFPGGLDKLIAEARQMGMQFGLWFAPDSSSDFANWQRDADAVLTLHRDLGVNYIKIDGVKAHTRAGQANLRRFFDRVLEESAGHVTFDLDVTAEVRPGYWGLMHAGPLFVENRYTDYHRYWPHQTLRNLWKLSQWIDPLRLRIEFLNNQRNASTYIDDPLAPQHYDPAYLFATTMMANPLGWFEVSNLPESWFAELPGLVKLWKQHRDAMFSGTIYPVGREPDGKSWTGFVTVGGQGAYALIFRELTPESQTSLEAPLPPGEAHVLFGDGCVRVENGRLEVSIPRKLGFVWAKVG